jgi:hypothetical protein
VAAAMGTGRAGRAAVAGEHALPSPPRAQVRRRTSGSGRPAAPLRSATGRAKPARCNRAGGVAQLREGRDAGREAAAQRRLGFRQRLPQRLQRAEAGERGEEQPVRRQRAADLISAPGRSFTQCSERRRRPDRSSRARREDLLVGRHGQPAAPRAMWAERSAETDEGMPRAASLGATTPRPPRSSARRSAASCRPAGRAALRRILQHRRSAWRGCRQPGRRRSGTRRRSKTCMRPSRQMARLRRGTSALGSRRPPEEGMP